MKIGLVLSSPPGYSETFFKNKIAGLIESGYTIKLFVDYTPNGIESRQDDIVSNLDFKAPLLKRILGYTKILYRTFFRHPKRSLLLYQLNKSDGMAPGENLRNLVFNEFLLNHQLEWLHFGFGMLAVGRENVAQAIESKMAVSFRGFDLYLSPLKHKGCYEHLFRKKVRYHVLSNGMKNRLIARGSDANDISVIPPAIDISLFNNKKHYSSSDKVNRIITVARLHWVKGLEYTLEALALLLQSGKIFHYSIVGDGEDYERLVFTAHQLGLTNHVSFLGRLSPNEVKEQLKRSEIYLQYSIQEGFGNALLEAQAMGLLCIVSDADGLRENVLNEKTGWVVPKRTPNLLAQRIESVIDMPSSYKQEISKQAVERVRENFNLKEQKEAFVNFYNKIL